jgi:ring-1,2-phenylacetyl-CoA epoxidase subunit PaaE
MQMFHSLPVTCVERAAEDALCLTLAVPAALRDEFSHDAGQHVTVRRTIGEREERRTYSIVSSPGEPVIRLGIRIQPGGRVSQDLANCLRPGDALDVGRPAGRFRTTVEPGRSRRRAAFASGSGITPVLALASDVLARERASHFTLFYGNRSAARCMFLEDILALKNRYVGRLNVHFIMSREPQQIDLLNGRIDAVKIAELAGRLFEPEVVDEYFVCGPGRMVEEVRDALKALGGEAPVHIERFTTGAAAGFSNALPVPAAAEAAMATISVTMDGRRRSFPMAVSDGSVLQAAERAGIALPYSCRSGICATCRARIVEGEAQMASNVGLEPWEVEAGFVLCCQAMPSGPSLALTYDEK